MPKLPQNRQLKKLWDICNIITWNTPSTKIQEYFWWHILRAWPWDFWKFKEILLTKKTLSEKWLNEWKARLIKKWSVMLVAIWATIWKVGIASQDMVTNQQINTFEGNTEIINNEFIYYYFRNIHSFFMWKASQTTMPILNKTQCKEIQIPLPPLETQKAIVAKLDEIFAKLDQTKAEIQKNIQATDEVWKSSLNKIFEEGEWEMKELGDENVLKIIDGDRWTHYPKKSEFHEKEFCLFLNTSNVRIWERDFTKKDFITKEKDSLLRKGKLEYNDVVLTTRWTIWNCAYYTEKIWYENVRVNSWMVLLRSNLDKLNPNYLITLIISPYFEKQRNKYASWSAQPQLPIKVMKNIQIPLPPPPKQREIVAHLDQLSTHTKQLKQKYQSQLDHIEELRKSVLDKAFKGELI